MTGSGAPQKPPRSKKRKKRPKPVSLHPLDFDTAMRGLLAVKPATTKKKPGGLQKHSETE